MKSYNKTHGFGLIEVLITIATMSIVAIILITILTFTISVNKKVPEKTAKLMSAIEALQYIEESIKYSHYSSVGIKDGKILLYPKPCEDYGEVYAKGENLYFAYEKLGVMYPQPLLNEVDKFDVSQYGKIIYITLKMKNGEVFEKFYDGV